MARASAAALTVEIAVTDEATSADGGVGLRRYLLEQCKCGQMTATAVSTTAWWATKAGAVGIDDLALHPSGTHHSEHLSAAIQTRADTAFYTAGAPMWDSETNRRVLVDFPVNLPHEQFAEEWFHDPSAWDPAGFDAMNLSPVFHTHDRIVAWSCNILAEGTHPEFNHLGLPFADELRHSQRGFPLADGRVCALTEMRADLLEIVQSLGLKNFSNYLNPCFACSSNRDSLRDFPATMEDNAWLQRDATAYDITLMRALVKREVHDKRALKNLMKSMAFGDKSSGCTLCEDFAPLDLKKGCRLIEAGEVVDVHDLMSIELPAVFTFFDTNINMGLNVVCPLFIIKGFTVQRSQAHLLPQRRRDQVGKITFKMFDKGRLKAKAAESRHLLPLAPLLCRGNAHLFGQQSGLLAAAREALENVQDVMQREPRSPAGAGAPQLALCTAVGATVIVLRLLSRPQTPSPSLQDVGKIGLEQQKRVVVNDMVEGMAAWPRALRELQYLAGSTNHVVTIPCVNLTSGRSTSCKHGGAKSFADLFDLTDWGLTPFDAELDSDQCVRFSMCSLPSCAGDMAPKTIQEWTDAVSSCRSVGVEALSADRVVVQHTQLSTARIDNLMSPVPEATISHPGRADNWPQFNFSAAREAEVERILAANGLRPSTGGHAGNYVVYNWRSEAVADINYTQCAQELLSHIRAHSIKSGKRLVLVSDMPFNISAMPSLWGSGALKIGREPTFPAARKMLIDAGFTKIEIMATKAGYDLRRVPPSYVSIWDAIIARGGEKLVLCRAEECARCALHGSKFMSLLSLSADSAPLPHGQAGVLSRRLKIYTRIARIPKLALPELLPCTRCFVAAVTSEALKFMAKETYNKGSEAAQLRQEWANKYRLPLQAVGLEDDVGNELNLDDTPSSLGWKPGADVVRVVAFPKEEAYMERESGQTNLPQAGAATASAQLSASNGDGARAEAELAAPAAAPPPDSNKGEQVGSGKRAAAASAAEAPPKQAKVGSAAAPKKAAGSAKSAAAARASEASPEGDEKIIFQQSNPKRVLSRSVPRSSQACPFGAGWQRLVQ
ncbi:unnamed protein product [Prorocentrum cordatum]|uniref:Uncharacterized protein n=1 Tax=Prorocentrum cordatum TaxID=2364126 RepID=A0ABN9PGI4_9DINO|nr:unnamed protein product [Polarella glacialis]